VGGDKKGNDDDLRTLYMCGNDNETHYFAQLIYSN
jgi:hypothetical protein